MYTYNMIHTIHNTMLLYNFRESHFRFALVWFLRITFSVLISSYKCIRENVPNEKVKIMLKHEKKKKRKTITMTTNKRNRKSCEIGCLLLWQNLRCRIYSFKDPYQQQPMNRVKFKSDNIGIQDKIRIIFFKFHCGQQTISILFFKFIVFGFQVQVHSNQHPSVFYP